MLQVDKKTLNVIRGTFRKISALNKERYEDFKKKNREAAAYVIFNFKKDKKAVLERLNRMFNTKFPENLSEDGLLDILDMGTLKSRIECEILETLRAALSRDGFNKVTYGLPYFCWATSGLNIDYSILTITGIKKNAQEKTLDGILMDTVEKGLFEYEKRMAAFIADDYTIDVESTKVFLDIFKEYLEYFWEQRNLETDLEPNFSYEEILNVNIVSMAIYIAYSKIDRKPTLEEIERFLRIFLNNLRSSEPTDALEQTVMYEYSFYEFHKNILDNIVIVPDEDDDEVKPEPIGVEIKRNPLDEYLENGVVIKPCEMAVFEELLENSGLSQDRKRELALQMKNLINRRVQEEFDRRLEEKRKTVLSPHEQELYRLGKADHTGSLYTKDIDAIIEMMLEDITPEDEEILREEMKPSFEILEGILVPDVQEEEEPGVIYYTCSLKDKEGKVIKVPYLLLSIKASKKDEYKSAYASLNKLLDGLVGGDRPLIGNNLPCRIYIKGNDFKIFYTIINDVIIILDGARKDEGYQRILSLVKKPEFKTFLKEVKEFIQEGNIPKGKNATDLILAELKTAKSIKQKK